MERLFSLMTQLKALCRHGLRLIAGRRRARAQYCSLNGDSWF